MMSCADLEIGLHRRDADSYGVELRFSQPQSDADVRLLRGESAPVHFDFPRLRELGTDSAAYGLLLGQGLLSDGAIQQVLAQARVAAQSQGVSLRLRLLIGPSAPELHSLRWETLRHPQDDRSLLTGEDLHFSRYLSSVDWRPVRLQPKKDLSALVVIANPGDLANYAPTGQPFQPVDVAGELARARSALGTIPVQALASGGQATLGNLVRQLRAGHDILFLVCHGALVGGEPWLWLEDEHGATDRVSGAQLVISLQEMQERPRLVVLASCQSGGDGEQARSSDGGALSTIGPRLAEAGIPAVLAMQGNVSMDTMARFTPIFFEELQRDGQVDRAVTVARGAVRDRPDWWMPVLFMRLKSGRIWYVPGFGDEQSGLEKWPALLSHIGRHRCTPILGPGLSEMLFGSRREIARQWAETYNFPMAPHSQDAMPQVAQYLAVHQDPMFPRDRFEEALRRALLRRYEKEAPEGAAKASLDQLLAWVRARRSPRASVDPYQTLARLPLPIYVTTDPSPLLFTALKAAGKDPQLELCRWNHYLESLPSIYDREPSYRPDKNRPLVFQLFGNLSEPDSLVLTEDDYFDFLIGVTSNKDLIPTVVRRALSDTALLFLGFRMEEWDFRVLFRSIMSQEGRGRRSRYAHVAVQLDPEEGRILEPERARRFLESYFEDADISIYWGSVEDFMRELRRKAEAVAT